MLSPYKAPDDLPNICPINIPMKEHIFFVPWNITGDVFVRVTAQTPQRRETQPDPTYFSVDLCVLLHTEEEASESPPQGAERGQQVQHRCPTKPTGILEGKYVSHISCYISAEISTGSKYRAVWERHKATQTYLCWGTFRYYWGQHCILFLNQIQFCS